MRLYHSPGTRSTRVLWLLEELGAPFDATVLTLDETEPARAAAGRERFAMSAAIIDQQLASSEWMVGDAFSVADVIVGDGMRLGAWMELLGDFANIQSYVARLQARPAFQRAAAIA